MARRLILDTSILIGLERGSVAPEQLGADDDTIAIAAITEAEFRVGIELATNERQRARREAAMSHMLAAVEVLPYTSETARHHARLLAHVHQSGARPGAHDLIIAAHAAQAGYEILSADAKAHFGDIIGVTSCAIDQTLPDNPT